MELTASITCNYPEMPAKVLLRSQCFNRANHERINSDVQKFQQTLEPMSLSIGPIIEWVQENLQEYVAKREEAGPSSNMQDSSDDKQQRLWIHSHHIYSTAKMKNMEDWAKELNLSGFLLPGKPGFVCVEGDESSTQIWWQRVSRGS